MPAQDRVRPYQQQDVPQLPSRELVEQAGQDRAVGTGERGPVKLALQDQ
ncbi:hypothetical protein [Streptomyces sp. NPDC059928]